MARAKGRVAELAASNWPRASWDWEEPERGTGPTCAADTWAPPPSSEAPRTAQSSATDGSAGNGNAGTGRPAAPSSAAGGRDHDAVLVGSGGGGLRCGRGRPGCRSHRCRNKCGFGVVGFGWPPLAVVPVLVPCTVVPLANSIRSKFVSNQAGNEFRVPFSTCSLLILSEIAAKDLGVPCPPRVTAAPSHFGRLRPNPNGVKGMFG